MHQEEIREWALALPEVEESMPFGPDVVVFKTKGKIFLLLPLDTEVVQFNVKCDPERAIQLREEFPESILPGYHMNKKHWNTIQVDGRLKGSALKEHIQHSYELIRGKKKA